MQMQMRMRMRMRMRTRDAKDEFEKVELSRFHSPDKKNHQVNEQKTVYLQVRPDKTMSKYITDYVQRRGFCIAYKTSDLSI